MGNFPDTLGMLDRYSGGRLVSGLVQGDAVETLQAGIDPHRESGAFRRSPRPDHEVPVVHHLLGWLAEHHHEKITLPSR